MSDPRDPRRAVPGPLIGMVHLAPLPGAPRWSRAHGRDPMVSVIDRALRDAQVLVDAGFHALLVENFGDAPFYPDAVPPETVAALAIAVREVVRTVPVPVGVNVLRNDAAAALGVAAATGASFVRVNIHTGGMYTDQGWIRGRAAETIRLRAHLAPTTAVLADVLVKHATPPPGLTLEAAARDVWERGAADAIIISGAATGVGTALDDLARVRRAVPRAVVLAGSGVTATTVAATLQVADGVIVGSDLQEDGRAGGAMDPDRVRRFVSAAGERSG